MKRALNAMLAWCWRVTAVCTVTAALVVSVMRVLLPHIGEYREEIQAWVSAYVSQPVVIEEITAAWRGWTPELALNNIELRDPVRGRTLTRFAHARISIDPWASLRNRRLVPGQLTVSGVELSLLRSADGAIRIEGVDPQSGETPGARQNALADWLQNQRNLTVESATITWRDDAAMFAPVVFSDVWLHIASDGERRQLAGSARLPPAVGTAFYFLLDARGDLLTTQWSGELYLDGRGINPAAVLDYRRWLGLQLADGEVAFRLWSRWEEARLIAVDGQVQAEHVAVGLRGQQVPDPQRFVLERARGNLRVRRGDGASWTVALEKLDVTTRYGAWPRTELAVTLTPAAEPGATPALVGHAGFVRLQDVAQLITHVGAVPEAVRAPLADLRPQGELREVRVGYFPAEPPERRFFVRARFSGIHTRPMADVPGIAGLTGRLAADAAGGRLELEGAPVTVDFGQRLPAPLGLERLAGELTWRRAGAGWMLHAPRVELHHPALAFTVGGEIEWQPGSPPQAMLLAQITGGDLERLPAVVPRGWLEPRGYRWITEAVQGGRITSGAGVLRGPLARFPFKNNDGAFDLRFTVADALLEFSPKWPRLEEIEAEIRFAGPALEVRARGARMLGAALQDVRARIEDLTVKGKVVEAHGRARASVAATRDVIAASPLADGLGAQLAGIDIDGELALDLDIDIPLRPGAKPASRGTVHLAGNRIAAREPRLTLEEVTGALAFEGPRWSAAALEARYLGAPVRLALEGGMAGGALRSRYVMEGTADPALLAEQLEALAPRLRAWAVRRGLLEALAGHAPWRAELTESTDGARRMRLSSTLEGLAVALPEPAGKDAPRAQPFELETRLGGPARRLSLRYGEDISAVLDVAPGADGRLRLVGGGVGFGTEAQPAAGRLQVTGSLPALSVTAWQRALRAVREPDGTGLPIDFDLQVERLEALGQRFPHTHLAGTLDASGWRVTADGESLAGRVHIPRAEGEPVQAELATLRIASRSDGEGGARRRPDPAGLPPIQARCERLVFGDIELGRAELGTEPRPDGLHLNELALDSQDFAIRARGDWLTADGAHMSHFRIDAQAPDLGRFLARFGYTGASVEGGVTDIVIDATWPGSPADFTLAGLEGELGLTVVDGRLLDVDPKAGRVFGLLSVQTLPRRLSLDFTDLFMRGFAFDRIEGSFQLERGNAYTNNLVMEGPAARVEVTGRTGLAAQDYDQLVTVRPQLASSLPVASALFGPAGAGVGAVLFLGQKVFKSLPDQLDRMLRRQYSVTGGWQEPQVEQIGGLDLSFGG